MNGLIQSDDFFSQSEGISGAHGVHLCVCLDDMENRLISIVCTQWPIYFRIFYHANVLIKTFKYPEINKIGSKKSILSVFH